MTVKYAIFCPSRASLGFGWYKTTDERIIPVTEFKDHLPTYGSCGLNSFYLGLVSRPYLSRGCDEEVPEIINLLYRSVTGGTECYKDTPKVEERKFPTWDPLPLVEISFKSRDWYFDILSSLGSVPVVQLPSEKEGTQDKVPSGTQKLSPNISHLIELPQKTNVKVQGENQAYPSAAPPTTTTTKTFPSIPEGLNDAEASDYLASEKFQKELNEYLKRTSVAEEPA